MVVIIGLTGLVVFMYPSTAAWWSQYHESKAIVQFQDEVLADKDPGNEVRLQQARKYNEKLSTGQIDVSGESRVPTLLGESDPEGEYWSLLSSAPAMMARLKIPAIDVDLPIYHGTSDTVLAHGVGHLQGTSLPVGGQDTHSVLTAHTGLATATLFNNLKKLEVGDTFTISVAGEVLTYEVYETQTILPEETGSLIVQGGKDIVTLVTCTPLGINTHRYLVTAKRVTPTPEADIAAAQAVPDIPGFPWWAVILPAGVVAGGVFMWRAGYPPKPRKKKSADR
ncbi:class C sortase [Actinomycetaceae bacterium MB13-C1-2]|nr:class C sortase [Actinomycetaceae bacterium MB13-C1-2]